MAQQKRGLGKGLGALIPTGPVTLPGGAVPGRSDATGVETPRAGISAPAADQGTQVRV